MIKPSGYLPQLRFAQVRIAFQKTDGGHFLFEGSMVFEDIESITDIHHGDQTLFDDGVTNLPDSASVPMRDRRALWEYLKVKQNAG